MLKVNVTITLSNNETLTGNYNFYGIVTSLGQLFVESQVKGRLIDHYCHVPITADKIKINNYLGERK